MKKIVLSAYIGITIAVILFFVTQKIEIANNVPIVLSEETNSTTQTPLENKKPSTLIFSNPQTLRIPRLNVVANVEKVALDEKQNMDVPKKWENVGWYELGFKPGENGSAVIAGHYDTPDGKPGVFYELSTLQLGDEIIVEENGEKLTYAVTGSQVYKFDKVPLEEVFNSTDQKRLNLITCDGIYDKNAKNYSNRFIVYAVLQENK